MARSASPLSFKRGRACVLGGAGLLAVMGGLAGCGVVYFPVSVPSQQSLLFNDDERFPYDLRVINLTFASAAEANARWPFSPRPIPNALRSDAGPALQQGYTSATSLGWNRATTQGVSGQLPNNPSTPYRIGSGDVLVVNNAAAAVEGAGLGQPVGIDAQNEYQVSENGDIFVPELGFLQVAGETLESTRRTVQERMEEVFVAPIAVVNIKDFRSKSYSVTGASISPYVESVTTQPETLREAVIKAASRSPIYDGANIELRRDGRRFVAAYQDIVYGGMGQSTVMVDDDQVRVLDNTGESARSAELDQTIQSAQLSRSRLELQNQQIELQRLQNSLSRQQFELQKRTQELSERADQRSQTQLSITERADQRSQQQFELSRRAQDLQERAQVLSESQYELAVRGQQIDEQSSARAQEQLEISRRAQQVSERAQQLSERAEARAQAQYELSQRADLRSQTQLDLSTRADQRSQTQLDLSTRADQRSQEQLELSRRAQDLTERGATRDEDRLGISKLQTGAAIHALPRDYVYVGGEVGLPDRMTMPFGSDINLADALMESRGFNPEKGDPRGINVVRIDNPGSSRPTVYVFTLDARNVANLSVATMFQLRPNDFMYVTPQPVTNWARTLSQLLPSVSGIISTGIAAAGN